MPSFVFSSAIRTFHLRDCACWPFYYSLARCVSLQNLCICRIQIKYIWLSFPFSTNSLAVTLNYGLSIWMLLNSLAQWDEIRTCIYRWVQRILPHSRTVEILTISGFGKPRGQQITNRPIQSAACRKCRVLLCSGLDICVKIHVLKFVRGQSKILTWSTVLFYISERPNNNLRIFLKK
jgi:hypothetical protein